MISMMKPRRGEICKVSFDPSKGDEIQKIRPAVVINNNEIGRLALSIIVPVTDWKDLYERYPWFVKLPPTTENGLTKMSGADAFQIKSVSHNRFQQKIGRVTNQQLKKITTAVALCIDYEP